MSTINAILFKLPCFRKAKQIEVKAVNGKKYYDNLNTGAVFKYITSDGTVVTAKKFTPSYAEYGKLYNFAACEVIDGIEIKKSTKRYPRFYQLVIPA